MTTIERHRFCFNVPQEIYDTFHQHLPYKGEKSAFLNRCIRALVEQEDPTVVMEEILKMAQQARLDVSLDK